MITGQEGSTRKLILNMLKTRSSLSVSEMAKDLGITEMAVRRHLNTLERDGYVTSALVRQSVGRPAHLYSLTEQADECFPKNYDSLTLDLLAELESDAFGDEAVGKLFTGREEKLVLQYQSRMDAKTLEERVKELAEIQNQGGYMAEWERDVKGDYFIHEYNCPITQVAKRYNQACECELSLFERLLHAHVERTECLAQGGGKCTYRIRQRNQVQ